MKKIVAIFFLTLYGISSVGATVHMHYCMAKFIGWSLSHNKNEKCGKCGMENKKTTGCCKDEHKQIKISGDQNYEQAASLVPQHFFVSIILTHHYDYNFTQSAVAVAFPKSNAPPPRYGIPIYLLNNVFRI